jgi:L-ascorbate metabolism protein UlaG (beta-lactamase superfamily)
MAAMLFPSDTIKTAEGGELKIIFFAHASLAFEYEGRHIYNDPVSDFADYNALPKADIILVGHEHGDHLDATAIEALSKPGTVVFGNGTAIEALGHGEVLGHGERVAFDFPTADMDPFQLFPGKELPRAPHLFVEAVAAYNMSPSQLGFHPEARKHNGYILTFGGVADASDGRIVGGTRVYVAGDGEDTPEMMALRDIDIAFLPVNQPYTMTEEQAARAVLAIRPKIFYPYHYGQVEHRTDLGKLEKLLEGSGIEVRIRPME